MTSIYVSLASLLFNDKYSDLTITCGGRTFKAHRAVVCSQSAFFNKACDGSFKESISGVIDLPEDDPYIFERFLQFLYTGTYEDGEYPILDRPPLPATMTPKEVQEELDQTPGVTIESGDLTHTSGGRDDEIDEGERDYIQEDEEDEEADEDENREQPEIEHNDLDKGDGDDLADNSTKDTEETFHRVDWPHSMFTSLRVYAMADKFDVPVLKLLARKRFYRTAEKIYVTCEDFPAVVDEMYRSTPPNDFAMRDIPCRLIAHQYYEERALRERMEPVMREHGDLAVGVLNYTMSYIKGFS